MDILDSSTFRYVMYFKFFMIIFIWGLLPLLIPADLIPFFGLHLTSMQISLVRLWGIIVLLDSFVYFYIYRNPHHRLSKYLLLFGILDNAGIGILLLVLTFALKLPWGVWINIPFQLFFGYWFLQFYKRGNFLK